MLIDNLHSIHELTPSVETRMAIKPSNLCATDIPQPQRTASVSQQVCRRHRNIVHRQITIRGTRKISFLFLVPVEIGTSLTDSRMTEIMAHNDDHRTVRQIALDHFQFPQRNLVANQPKTMNGN